MAKTNHLEALAAVGLLVLIMLVIEAQPAGATFPGKNGKIAYHGSDGHDFEIYTIRATGGTPFNVTHNTTNDTEPSYSPNGKRIAYRSSDGNDLEIYRTKAGGGGKFNVTDNTTNDFSPSWGSRP